MTTKTTITGRRDLMFGRSARRILITTLGCLLMTTLSFGQAWDWSTSKNTVDGIEHTLAVAQRPPGGEFDVIRLHGYRGAGATSHDAAVLYLPGTNMNGTLAVDQEDHNLWLYLAKRGLAVYALDYRTHAVGSGDLDDSSFMKQWTMGAFVDDGLAALTEVRRLHPGTPVLLAGFSRGVSLAFGVLSSSEPGVIDGLIALDGTFKSHRLEGKATRSSALAGLESSGNWASDVAAGFGWERRQTLMERAAAAPGGPPTEGSFASVGDQLAQVLYTAWRPGGLANAVDGFSDPAVLAELLAAYDRYYPNVQNAEGRVLGDHLDAPDLTFDDRWGELAAPMLVFASSGMGPEWVLGAFFSAVESGSRDVTLHLLEGYGHLDVLVGKRVRDEVFEPTLQWIQERLEHREP